MKFSRGIRLPLELVSNSGCIKTLSLPQRQDNHHHLVWGDKKTLITHEILLFESLGYVSILIFVLFLSFPFSTLPCLEVEKKPKTAEGVFHTEVN